MLPIPDKNQKRINPNSPEGMRRISEAIHAMTPDELYELVMRKPEGVEETNMNEELREYYKTHKPTQFHDFK